MTSAARGNGALRGEAAELAARPYKFTLELGEDEVWTAGVLEIPGAISEGDTPDQAIANVVNALQGVIFTALRDGHPVPEPFATRDFSGQLSLRLPPELHQRATTLAATEGVSLNRWLSAAVAGAAGYGSSPYRPISAAELAEIVRAAVTRDPAALREIEEKYSI